MNSQAQQNQLDSRLARLQSLITELEEKESLDELQTMLDEGVDPKVLLACCMEGMHRIGLRFEKGSYFLAALIMAGEIMRAATELLSPYLSLEQTNAVTGRLLLGTIQGDIHDLGKNLFALLLKCHGIEVVDLGVDVAGEVFLEEAGKVHPDLIGISCVLTTSIENLKQTVALLHQKLCNPTIPIIVGGTCLDERVAEYVGAPLWATNAATGLKICQRVLIESA